MCTRLIRALLSVCEHSSHLSYLNKNNDSCNRNAHPRIDNPQKRNKLEDTAKFETFTIVLLTLMQLSCTFTLTLDRKAIYKCLVAVMT